MKVSEGMSRLRRGLAGALLIAVVSAWLSLLFAMNDPVQIVRVSGDLSDAERAEVKAAVLHRLNGGLLGVSLDDVVADVTALSWTREVRARRVWPASVEVSVTKDPIAARWGAGGVLNSAGDVIVVAGTPDATLPLITCAHASGARAMRIFQILSEVLSDTQLKIAAIEERRHRGVASEIHQRPHSVARARTTAGAGRALRSRLPQRDQRPSRCGRAYRRAVRERCGSELARRHERAAIGVGVSRDSE